MAGDAGGRRLAVASLAVIALALAVGAFFVGTRMRAAAAPRPTGRPTVAATPAAPPTPSPTRSLGPADPGPRAWDALTGGECLRTFPSPWAPGYDVVPCRTAHAAQVTHVVQLSGSGYPGRTALRARLGSTCQEAVRLSAASRYRDLRVSSSYPTPARWATGDRTAYCFVSRPGAGALRGSLTASGG